MSHDADQIFEVFGNETRRKILEKLAEEPAYLNMLSRELGVSQQAILKHLDYLESKGFITSFRVEGEGGTPPKKYYKLNPDVVVLEGVARELMEFAEELDQTDMDGVLSIDLNLDDLENKISYISTLKPPERIRAIRPLINQLDSQLEKVAKIHACIASARSRLLELGREALREQSYSTEERRLIYRLLRMNEDELKEYFERSIRERTEWAEKMMQRFSELFGEE